MHAARSPLLGLFLVALVCGSAATIGCSRQTEGERCSLLNKDADCEDALVCTDANSLREGADGVDRCCPEIGDAVSDTRCNRRTAAGDGDGDGDGDSGAGGVGGESSDSTKGLGDACSYTSDCLEPFLCGPGGVCQYECNKDRDCGAGKVCSADRACVSG